MSQVVCFTAVAITHYPGSLPHHFADFPRVSHPPRPVMLRAYSLVLQSMLSRWQNVFGPFQTDLFVPPYRMITRFFIRWIIGAFASVIDDDRA